MGPLIDAESLMRRLAAGETVVLLDARAGPGSVEAYRRGHLEGAHHAHLEHHLSAPDDPRQGGRHPLPALDVWRRTVGAWGVGPDTPVVAYDAQSGGFAAARAWWMLRALGHGQAAVLDGGIQAALAAGMSLESGEPTSGGSPYPAASWTMPTVTADEVASLPAGRVLVDARARERWAGVTEPIDPVAGHIPGAVNVPWQDNVDAGQFRTPDALRALYTPQVDAAEQAVVYCGSGVTACADILAMEHAGMGTASLYVGSWSEWCRTRL